MKKMYKDGITRSVEDSKVGDFKQAGWVLAGGEPQPNQEKVIVVSDKVVSNTDEIKIVSDKPVKGKGRKRA